MFNRVYPARLKLISESEQFEVVKSKLEAGIKQSIEDSTGAIQFRGAKFKPIMS